MTQEEFLQTYACPADSAWTGKRIIKTVWGREPKLVVVLELDDGVVVQLPLAGPPVVWWPSVTERMAMLETLVGKRVVRAEDPRLPAAPCLELEFDDGTVLRCYFEQQHRDNDRDMNYSITGPVRSWPSDVSKD